jgi:hypothetical protein
MKARGFLLSAYVFWMLAVCAQITVAAQKPYKAPKMNYIGNVTWGARLDAPEGQGVAFGGQHKLTNDGRPRTSVKRDGKGVPIYNELREKNPLQKLHHRAWELRTRTKNLRARARHLYLGGAMGRTE